MSYLERKFAEENRDVLEGLYHGSIAFIRMNLVPEDVFSETDLQEWAETHGYVKK